MTTRAAATPSIARWRSSVHTDAGTVAILLLLAAVILLPPLAGGRAWPIALLVLVGVAAARLYQERRLPPVPLVLAVYLVPYVATALLHVGTLTGSDVARYFVRPLIAPAVAILVVTSSQRARVVILIVAVVLTQTVAAGGQVVRNLSEFGRELTVADSVTGTLGATQAGVLGLVVLLAATFVAAAWIGSALPTRRSLLVGTLLLATPIFTSTRAAVGFAPLIAIGVALACVAFVRGRSVSRRPLEIVAASIVSAIVMFVGIAYLYPGAFTGTWTTQSAPVLGGAAAQGLAPVPSPCARELNWSFGSGLGRWAAAGGARVALGASRSTNGAALRLESPGVRASERVTSPTFTACAGRFYTATAWVRASEGVPVQMTLSDREQPAVGKVVSGTGHWQGMSVSMRFRGTEGFVEVAPATKSRTMLWIDDVKVVQASAPGSPAGGSQPPGTGGEQVPAPKGVELLPGRFAQIRLAFDLRREGNAAAMLFGEGLGTTRLDTSAQTAGEVPVEQRTAGTWIGRVLTEAGWLGLAAFVTLLLWLLLIADRLWRGARETSDLVLAVALPGVVVLTGLGAVFTTVLDVRGYSILFWIVVGLALSAAADHDILGRDILGRGRKVASSPRPSR